uniref:Uncharacterized protein n=1 Tax=Cucumis melo TaxID=3656 RepID=A0A9I9ECF9_CUCME
NKIESKNKEYEFLQNKYEFLRLHNLTHNSIKESKEMESEIQQPKELYTFEY